MNERERNLVSPQYCLDIISAALERTITKLWVVVILLAVLLVGSNAAWIWYESSFEEVMTTETYEATTDGGGTAIANGSGEVTYVPG